MAVSVFHRFEKEELSLSIETLLSVWKSILSRDPSYLILSACEISARKLGSFHPLLTLTVVCELPTTSAVQTLEDLALVLANSVQEEIYKTSKTSSDQS